MARRAPRTIQTLIISASRRTDIPAFYSEWLMNRVREGHCLVPNPFNASQVSRVSLVPGEVEALVLWSKNPAPMIDRLSELEDRGFFCLFQLTLNDYPRELEPNLPSIFDRLETFSQLSKRLGPERVIWRYDPIMLTEATPVGFHLRAFERIARALRGQTRRVMLSLLDVYRKTERRMAPLVPLGFGVDPETHLRPEAKELLSGLAEIARREGMTPLACAEETDFSSVGIEPGSCIDGALLRCLGRAAPTQKDPGQRPSCRCVRSRDIGVTDSCLHGCRYCYATRSDELARRRFAEHRPDSPLLFGRIPELVPVAPAPGLPPGPVAE